MSPLQLCLLLSTLLAGQQSAVGAPGPTAFTYQGHLDDNGAPTTGLYDFSFKLYDAPSGGTQVGVALSTNGAPVRLGRFSVLLDFGGGVFDGSSRWLDIGVKSNGLATPFTSLTPELLT